MNVCTYDLNLTTMSHETKHQKLFGTIASLKSGETLRITNDHDPKPLRHRLEAKKEGTFGWEYVQEGPETWIILISRN